MILIGLGSNLNSPAGDSRATIEAAFRLLDVFPLRLVAASRLWRTRPVPDTGQPWFVNAVASIETGLEPGELLAHLHVIEHDFGRERGAINAARTLDLDLLDYRGRLMSHPALPHPRLAERAFVLLPLRDIAADWRHPAGNRPLSAMIAALPPDQSAEPVPA